MEKRPAKTSPGFLKVTPEQIAIPHAGRGHAGDVNRLTGLEYRVMECVAYDTRFGGRSRMTNLEIGLFLRMDGPNDKIARSIMNVISGRRSHGKRLPGLKGKGFLKVFMDTNPRNSWQRQLEVTAKWVDPKSIRIAETDSQESAPAAATLGTAAIAAATLATQAEIPTREQREEVFGRLPRVFTPPELAERLVNTLRNRFMNLELVDGGIKPHRMADDAAPLSTAELAVLKWLREEVVAVLRPKTAPGPAAETTPKAAPRVTNPAEIRALIGRLSAAPPGDETDCEVFADSLVVQFKDEDPDLSRKTYLGIARDAARGELALSILLEAFEDACKPQKKNRGAAFIAKVKRLKADLKASEGKD
jgi:hypothetical protein